LAQVELNEDGSEVELGKGAFGVVVKGSYRMAPVAIKRLRDQAPEQQVAFLKEMAILRACRGSRYIVPFVGASLQPVRSPHLFSRSRHRQQNATQCYRSSMSWAQLCSSELP